MSKKRKQEQPVPFQGEFSFVNKDAGNIDSKDHNAAVTWHVMNRYERWKKQEKAKRLRTSANVPIQLIQQPSEASSSRQKTPPATETSSEQDNPFEGALSMDLFEDDPWLANPPLQIEDTMTENLARDLLALSSSISNPSGVAEVNPFSMSMLADPISATLPVQPINISALAPTPLTSMLMSFAYDYFIPAIWPNELGTTQHNYEIAKTRDDIAAITEDSCYANACLSLLAGILSSMNEDENLAYQSRYFQGQATIEVRQRMESLGEKDILTLKAMLKLFSSESINDNTAVARVHLRMLRRLIRNEGGVILLDSWFREDLLSSDCYFSLKYGTRPLFPAKDWTPGPLGQSWKATLSSVGISDDQNGNVDLCINHIILKTVLIDLRELFQVEDFILCHENSATEQLLRWRQLRKYDCISRIADHFVNLTFRPQIFERPSVQALTCTATALFTNMLLGCPEPVRLGLKLLEVLQKTIIESENEDETQEYQRLFLWALYVADLGTTVHPTTADTPKFFKQKFTYYSSMLGAEKWVDTRAILQYFLFSDRLHQEISAITGYRVIDPRNGYYAASGCSWREPVPIEFNPSPPQEQTRRGKRRAKDG